MIFLNRLDFLARQQKVVLDFILITLAYFCIHGQLLNYFDAEGSFILTAGEHWLQYGILSTPEYQYIGGNAPTSPYYVGYFFAGLSTLLFGHTSLGAVAHFKFFSYLLMLCTYVISRQCFGSRLYAWGAVSFLLLFPFSINFISTRVDPISAFFGWLAVALLLYRVKKDLTPDQDLALQKKSILFSSAFWAGVCTALSWLTHPYGLQFYAGACGLILLNFFGPIRWVRLRITWEYALGLSLVAGYFIFFVFDLEVYTYIAKQFGGRIFQFLPLSEAPQKFLPLAKVATDVFFFKSHAFADPPIIAQIFGILVFGLFTAFILEWLIKEDFKISRYFLLVLVWFCFLYIYAVSKYRQYIFHALPLWALMTTLTLKTMGSILHKTFPPAHRAWAVGLSLSIFCALGFISGKNILNNDTLFNAPSQHTLIEDTIEEIEKVIPRGSRVAGTVGHLFLFPNQIVRSPYVFFQFQQPPIPKHIINQQKNDGIVYQKTLQDDEVRSRFDRQIRNHFEHFLPNFLIPGYFQELNCAELVATIKATVKYPPPTGSGKSGHVSSIKIYKTNYNEWPFKNIPVGARLYPSFSDPVTAMRYREFLMEEQDQPIVKAPPVLMANAGSDIEVATDLDSNQALVTLDGSRSWVESGKISSYLWQQRIFHTPNNNLEEIGRGQSKQVSLPLGRHTIHLVIEDAQGRCSRDTLFVKVDFPTASTTNFALASNGAKATDHLPHSGLPATNAIDGVTQGDFSTAWIAEADQNAWWQVELGGGSHIIHSIVLRFRNEYPASNQANHIEIRASNDPEFKIYDTLAKRTNESFPESGLWRILNKSQKPYHYLRLVKLNNSHTSFAEFEVYGVPEGKNG